MTDNLDPNISTYFQAIEKWRSAYPIIRFNIIGIRRENTLEIVSARIIFEVANDQKIKPAFHAAKLEAHQVLLNPLEIDAQELTRRLTSATGFHIAGLGCIRLPCTSQVGVFVAPPALLHPEGLNTGNRLAVLSISGGRIVELLPQPTTDWQLKAADVPYDSVQELAAEYGLSAMLNERSLLEIVAFTAIQVLAESSVIGTQADAGVFMARSLERSHAKLGYRVLHQGKVVERGVIKGSDLNWIERDIAAVGTGKFNVPTGAVVQLIASYAGETHHVQWRTDPKTFLNPRRAIISIVDPSDSQMQNYLHPEINARGKASEDFEAAVAWLLWGLGFSTALFGTNPKTRDAFDIIATTPRGDFLVVECTIGLLRADGKLSKLAARTAKVRDSLAASNMQHLQVLPAIFTAMTSDQIAADSSQAADLGVLVITHEDLQRMQKELFIFPDANAFFDQSLRNVLDRQSASNAQKRSN